MSFTYIVIFTSVIFMITLKASANGVNERTRNVPADLEDYIYVVRVQINLLNLTLSTNNIYQHYRMMMMPQ